MLSYDSNMKRAVMDDDSAECYLNNFCTQAPNNNNELDCLSTDSENSDHNGNICTPNSTSDKSKFPVSINCTTVACVTSPNHSLPKQHIVTPNYKGLINNGHTEHPECIEVETTNESNLPSAQDHLCYNVLLTKRRANLNKQKRIDMMSNIINTRHQSYVPPSMLHSDKFLH